MSLGVGAAIAGAASRQSGPASLILDPRAASPYRRSSLPPVASQQKEKEKDPLPPAADGDRDRDARHRDTRRRLDDHDDHRSTTQQHRVLDRFGRRRCRHLAHCRPVAVASSVAKEDDLKRGAARWPLFLLFPLLLGDRCRRAAKIFRAASFYFYFYFGQYSCLLFAPSRDRLLF